MNGYYNPPEQDAPRGPDWTEIIYTVFLIIAFIWLVRAAWQSHLNGPCYRDEVPAEYRATCKR